MDGALSESTNSTALERRREQSRRSSQKHRLKLARTGAAVAIQAQMRGALARRRQRALHHAATKIQALVRRHQRRQRLRDAAAAAVAPQEEENMISADWCEGGLDLDLPLVRQSSASSAPGSAFDGFEFRTSDLGGLDCADLFAQASAMQLQYDR